VKKGVELPINILVIVAIAVIVLLGLVALYFTGFGPFSATAGIEAVKNQACTELNPRAGCTSDVATITVNYDVNGDGDIILADDNLQTFGIKYYGCPAYDAANPSPTTSCVKRICSCPGY